MVSLYGRGKQIGCTKKLKLVEENLEVAFRQKKRGGKNENETKGEIEPYKKAKKHWGNGLKAKVQGGTKKKSVSGIWVDGWPRKW